MRCDTHVHIVGPITRYPQIPTRTYLAGEASLDTLRALGAARGMTRFVIVQASFYGADNTQLLESLDALGPDGRGVAVIDPAATSAATLADLGRRGVRGLRLNLYSTAAGRDVKRLDDVFAALAKLAAAEVFARSPAPVVIDHYGVYGRATPQRATPGAGCSTCSRCRMFGSSCRRPTESPTMRWRRARTRLGSPRSSRWRRAAACGAATGHTRRCIRCRTMPRRRCPIGRCPKCNWSMISSRRSATPRWRRRS